MSGPAGASVAGTVGAPRRAARRRGAAGGKVSPDRVARRRARHPSPASRRFGRGLRELGYVEGRNIVIEYRWAEGTSIGFRRSRPSWSGLKVDVIVAVGGGARAAKQATSTIPIVIVRRWPIPVGLGLVASLARPGGNITGLAGLVRRTRREAAGAPQGEPCPGLTRVAVLWRASQPRPAHGAESGSRRRASARCSSSSSLEVDGPEQTSRAPSRRREKDRADALIVCRPGFSRCSPERRSIAARRSSTACRPCP